MMLEIKGLKYDLLARRGQRGDRSKTVEDAGSQANI